MKPTRANAARGAAYLLFSLVLLFSAFAFSASVEDSAKLYLGRDEATAMNITEFSSSGGTYYMVSSGGTELLVLKPGSAGSFLAVESQAELETAMGPYITKAYGSVFSEDQAQKAKSDFDNLSKAAGVCIKPMNGFLTNSFLIYYIKQIDDRGSAVPGTSNAIRNLTVGNATAVSGISDPQKLLARANLTKLSNGTHAIVVGGIAELGNLTYSLSSSKPASEVRTDLDSINKLLSELKPVVDLYQGDYAYLYTTKQHFAMFSNQPCTFTSSAFAALESDFATAGSVPSEAELASRLAISTKDRAERYSIRLVYQQETEKLAGLALRQKNVQDRMNLVGLDLSGLSANVTSMNVSTAKVELATSVGEANELDGKFKAMYSATEGYVSFVESDQVYGALNGSTSAISAAQLSIDTASTRIGKDNSDVVALKEKYATLRTELDQARSDLAAGKTAGIVPKIQNITADLEDLNTRAAALKPVSEQFDAVIIGGLILIIVVGAAVIYYYRSKKPPAEVSPSVRPPSSSVIIGRP